VTTDNASNFIKSFRKFHNEAPKLDEIAEKTNSEDEAEEDKEEEEDEAPEEADDDAEGRQEEEDIEVNILDEEDDLPEAQPTSTVL